MRRIDEQDTVYSLRGTNGSRCVPHDIVGTCWNIHDVSGDCDARDRSTYEYRQGAPWRIDSRLPAGIRAIGYTCVLFVAADRHT